MICCLIVVEKDLFGVLVRVNADEQDEQEVEGGVEDVGVGSDSEEEEEEAEESEDEDEMELDSSGMMDTRERDEDFEFDDEEGGVVDAEGICMQANKLDADHLAVMLRSMCFHDDGGDAPVPDDPNDLPMNCSRLATVS